MKTPESLDPDQPVYYYSREERLAKSSSLRNCPSPSGSRSRNRLIILTFLNVFALFILGNTYLHFLNADLNVVETDDLRLDGEGRLNQGRAYLTIKASARQERQTAASVMRMEVLDAQGRRLLEVHDNLPLRKDEQRLLRFELPDPGEKTLSIKIEIQGLVHDMKVRLKG